MATPVNAAKGSELIRSQTGRSFTRQALEKACRNGGLRGSPCVLQLNPLRVDADTLVEQYLSRVAPYQSLNESPGKRTTDPPPTVPSDPLAERPPERNKRPAQPAPAPTASRSGPTPDYNTERAWTEYERNRGLMLANLKDEGLLVYREDMEQAYSAVLANMMARAYAAAKQIKLQIPHITIEEMNRIEKIVLDVFEETSQDDFEELPE